MTKMAVNFPLTGFPTFAFSLNYLPFHLVPMLVFNAYLFPPVTCIIYLSSVTILAWRIKSSVESVTLCGKTNFLCDSD